MTDMNIYKIQVIVGGLIAIWMEFTGNRYAASIFAVYAIANYIIVSIKK